MRMIREVCKSDLPLDFFSFKPLDQQRIEMLPAIYLVYYLKSHIFLKPF